MMLYNVSMGRAITQVKAYAGLMGIYIGVINYTPIIKQLIIGPSHYTDLSSRAYMNIRSPFD